jgi:chromosome segregation ATPase
VDPQTPTPPGAPLPPSTPGAFPAPPPSFPKPVGPSFPPPGDIKFPVKPGSGIKPLVLPRRPSPLQRAQEASQATAAARKSINTIMSQSRPPWGGTPTLSGSQVENLEKALRDLEKKAAEREMALAEAENKLAERDRALAETEALLQAREKVIDAMRKEKPAQGESTGTKLKEELDRQEASIKEQRAAQAEREEFLNQSETALFEKMQAQQEKETELEQKAEDLKKGMLKAGMIQPEAKEKA